jgi:hypothetical protein
VKQAGCDHLVIGVALGKELGDGQRVQQERRIIGLPSLACVCPARDGERAPGPRPADEERRERLLGHRGKTLVPAAANTTCLLRARAPSLASRGVTALAGGVIALVLVFVADGASKRQARWRTWAACCAQLAAIAALGAIGILVGRVFG